MRIKGARLLLLGLVIVLSGLLSGCFLRLTIGHVIYTQEIGEDIRAQIGAIFNRSTVAVCLDLGEGNFNCKYFVDGLEITSTFTLVSEAGFEGLLIDPLIVQVPEDLVSFSGTYDDGSGPQPLPITSIDAFEQQPGALITPEPGHRFLVLDLPANVVAGLPEGDPELGPEFDFSFTFERHVPLSAPEDPITIKAMFTGLVQVNGQDYYVPILPCESDFTQIPGVQIPVSDTPEDLTVDLGNLIRNGQVSPCDNQVYNFDGTPPITPLDVVVDIKPGSDPNSINCDIPQEVISAAVLTTETFDALTVDNTTVTFEGASEFHVNRRTGEPIRHVEDVDDDADLDLVFHFRLGDTDLTCDSTEGTLIGETFDGITVEGTDSVRMLDN